MPEQTKMSRVQSRTHAKGCIYSQAYGCDCTCGLTPPADAGPHCTCQQDFATCPAHPVRLSVPQEATTPDWAMRVTKKVVEMLGSCDGNPYADSDIANLIRQAGREQNPKLVGLIRMFISQVHL